MIKAKGLKTRQDRLRTQQATIERLRAENEKLREAVKSARDYIVQINGGTEMLMPQGVERILSRCAEALEEQPDERG